MPDQDAARTLFEEVTGRSDWGMLQPVTQESWRRRVHSDRSFIPSEHINESTEEAPPAEPLPPVEVVARPARPDEIPRGAQTVVNRAVRCGWDVSTSYARGPWIQSDGAWHVVSSILVRARRGDERFAALWLDKAWLKGAGYKLEFIRAPGGCLLKTADLKTLTESEVPHD